MWFVTRKPKQSEPKVELPTVPPLSPEDHARRSREWLNTNLPPARFHGKRKAKPVVPARPTAMIGDKVSGPIKKAPPRAIPPPIVATPASAPTPPDDTDNVIAAAAVGFALGALLSHHDDACIPSDPPIESGGGGDFGGGGASGSWEDTPSTDSDSGSSDD
jgi:hypothetical protein